MVYFSGIGSRTRRVRNGFEITGSSLSRTRERIRDGIRNDDRHRPFENSWSEVREMLLSIVQNRGSPLIYLFGIATVVSFIIQMQALQTRGFISGASRDLLKRLEYGLKKNRPGFHWLYSLSIYMAGFIGSTDMLLWLYSHRSNQKKLPLDRII
jgi:hypothetical protein